MQHDQLVELTETFAPPAKTESPPSPAHKLNKPQQPQATKPHQPKQRTLPKSILRKPKESRIVRLVEDKNAPKPYKFAFTTSTNIHKPSTLRAHTNWPKQGKRSPLRVQPSRTSKKKINTAVRINEASSLRVSPDNVAFTGEQIHKACAAAFAADQQEIAPCPRISPSKQSTPTQAH